MRPVDNDRWSGHVELLRNRRHVYAIEAWRDAFGSWRDGLRKKLDASVPVPNEIEEGRILVEGALLRAEEAEAADDARLMRQALTAVRRARSEATRAAALVGEDLLASMRRHPDRRSSTRSAELPLMVDRERARFGAWYELFPRSQGRDPKRPAATTFAEAEWRIPHVAEMGFDVLYVLPIHPIGHTNRKGRNNTLESPPATSGRRTPSASADGGHDTVAGASAGSRRSRTPRAGRGARDGLAMDIAIQESPDHPYVTQHPEWFRHSPDRLEIKYAENRRTKYRTSPDRLHGCRPVARWRSGTSGGASSPSGSTAASGTSASTTRTPSRSRSGVADRRCSATTPTSSSCRRRSRSRR